ncbi:MAG: hypothetical protein CFE24_07530 [Flavobacterium sp. BFFFF2]|nr:MAG: hypothetical protein CFE24_07530 [Flavobacterium sp. BFFFF2]
MACKSGFAKGKNDSYAGRKRPFLLVRFLWASKENEQNGQSAGIRLAESKTFYEKQSYSKNESLFLLKLRNQEKNSHNLKTYQRKRFLFGMFLASCIFMGSLM